MQRIRISACLVPHGKRHRRASCMACRVWLACGSTITPASCWSWWWGKDEPMGIITMKKAHHLGEYSWNFVQALNKPIQVLLNSMWIVWHQRVEYWKSWWKSSGCGLVYVLCYPKNHWILQKLGRVDSGFSQGSFGSPNYQWLEFPRLLGYIMFKKEITLLYSMLHFIG